jgi:nucleotide-binding universal stress UspA family protein
MYRRILVAVDGSQASELALREAIKLAREQGTQLRIVHVVDAVGVLVGGAEFVNFTAVEQTLAECGQRILEEAAAACSSAGLTAERVLPETGEVGQRVADVVAAEAKAWKADLIVLGTHGRGGIRHYVRPSVAEGIVQMSPAPVLLVHGS